jgi:hypothetical protein
MMRRLALLLLSFTAAFDDEHVLSPRCAALFTSHDAATHLRRDDAYLLPVASDANRTCTHDLYRSPKTGSTALYNQVQWDAALRSHVCWSLGAQRSSGWHTRPDEAHARPIVVALRHPVEHWASSTLFYARHEVDDKWSLPNGTVDLGAVFESFRSKATAEHGKTGQSKYVLRRPDFDDVVVCVGGGARPIHEQLRDRFRDPRICEVPVANKLGREQTPLAADARAWLEDYFASDMAIWAHFCGSPVR